jgi:hypothetical protein
MPPTPPTQRMGELHELHTAELLGGYKTKGSGSSTDKADGAHHHDDLFAFRWDGKSTKGKSITITLDMLDKLFEQAGGERPALPLRWYGNEALTKVLYDLIAIKDVDLSELLDEAGKADELRIELDGAQIALDTLGGELEAARARIRELEQQLAMPRVALGGQGGSASPGPVAAGGTGWQPTPRTAEGIPLLDPSVNDDGKDPVPPPHVPQLPWTIVSQRHLPGRVLNSGLYYDERGHVRSFGVSEVRVERSLGSGNRPRLMVNGVVVRRGDLVIDGTLRARVWVDRPEQERG